MTKAIIFDSSTLISFAMNGLFEEFRNLKKIFGGHFIITKEVKAEIIDRPLNIKRFELEALKINQLLDEKVLEMPSALGVNDETISKRTADLLREANATFTGKGKQIHLIDLGEASCLALSRILDEKNVKNVIAIDERTTRMLGEKPQNLQKLLQNKLHTTIEANKDNFKFFGEFKFIRSAELLYIAFKNDIVKVSGDDRKVLDALLYAVKFKGCSISDKEIDEIKNLA